jgi:hypothetical protein
VTSRLVFGGKCGECLQGTLRLAGVVPLFIAPPNPSIERRVPAGFARFHTPLMSNVRRRRCRVPYE